VTCSPNADSFVRHSQGLKKDGIVLINSSKIPETSSGIFKSPKAATVPVLGDFPKFRSFLFFIGKDFCQISLMSNGVPDKIEETPAKIPLTRIKAVPYSGGKFFGYCIQKWDWDGKTPFGNTGNEEKGPP
jgi:hypothetical protein